MKNNWIQIARLAVIVPLLALVVLGTASPARAADFRSGDVVVIDAGEVIDDDLFVTAERIEMNGVVKGDLFAFGQDVVINGTVEGSLFTGAQTAQINGQVDGSLYSGGYLLTVGPEASIGRNLYLGGYSLETQSGSTVGRSLYAGAYQALLSGEVARDVRAGLAALELNGAVNGDLYVELGEGDSSSSNFIRGLNPELPEVQEVTPGIHFGPDATVKGSLWYEGRVEQALPAAAVGGEVTFATPTPPERPERQFEPARTGGFANAFRNFSERAGEFIALLIVGGLLLRFWPNQVRRVSDAAQERPLPSTGWGLLVTLAFFVGVPLAAIALFALALLGGLITFGNLFSVILSVGGAALGLTVTGGLFVLGLVTKVIVGYLVGRLILSRLAPQSLTGRWGDLAALATGGFVYEVLRAVPFGFGWLVGVIVTLIGVGAIYFVVREALRRPAAPAPLAA